MRTAIRVSAAIAILSAAAVAAITIYLQIGISAGQKWSSFNEEGPHWPFTVFSVSLVLGVLAFAAFVGLQIKKGRQDRSSGPPTLN